MPTSAPRRPPGRRRVLTDKREIKVYIDAADLERLQRFSDTRAVALSVLARNLLMRYVTQQGY